jgi:hypothetical protein
VASTLTTRLPRAAIFIYTECFIQNPTLSTTELVSFHGINITGKMSGFSGFIAKNFQNFRADVENIHYFLEDKHPQILA